MVYKNIVSGRFIDRPNRFVAHVDIHGRTETVHVKNTGRCRELLVPGAEVWLERAENPQRKTKFDLVAVDRGGRLINMDAQAPNRLFAEWAGQGHFIPDIGRLRPEYSWGSSRFDFCAMDGERRLLIEVKGVTLEIDGGAYFPDAPTDRGLRHINELILARSQGWECFMVFIIQMEGVDFFAPNDIIHPQFGQALRRAQANGVKIIARDCTVEPGRVCIKDEIPVML